MPALIPLLGVAGTVGLMVAPDTILLWAAMLGLFGGASLAMALTLVAQRARDHDAASALSGMARSVGYLIEGGCASWIGMPRARARAYVTGDTSVRRCRATITPGQRNRSTATSSTSSGTVHAPVASCRAPSTRGPVAATA